MGILQRLRERFWFVPAMLCLAAFGLAQGIIAIDQRIGTLQPPPIVDLFIYRVGESGSRDILGAIATSSLAVAGTTFSITMAVLALTSSSYGPRLVRNFMVDRGNQIVLGVYVATFLYSLLVLRAIRVLGDPGNQDADVFVPHLAVNLAILLAVLNVGVLVYFIHHISASIQIWTLSSGIRTDLRATVERLYPGTLGRGPDDVEHADPEEDLPERHELGAPIPAGTSGYVQYIEEDDLIAAARQHDVVLTLQVRPGQYVVDDSHLALVHPAERVDDLEKAVRAAFVVADARSPYQDVEFAVQQLTEMAVRALSPGTNDPYTAVNALDDLSSGLALLAARSTPSAARYDADGVLRVHARGVTVVELVSSVLDAVRWYGTSAPLVMHRALVLADVVGARAHDRALRARLLSQVERLVTAFGEAGHDPVDVESFEEHAREVVSTLVAV